MTREEAVTLALSLFARYPTATRVDKPMVAIWANEFLEFERDMATEACLSLCRRNPSRWMPALDEFRAAIVDARLKAQRQVRKLTEPPPTEEEVETCRQFLRNLAARF